MNQGKSVLLIYPRYKYLLASSLEEPLGLLYVASALRQAGWDVDLLDLTFEKDLTRLSELLDKKPTAVGMSVTSPILDRALEVLAFIKDRSPTVPVIMGGPHATAFPEDGLSKGFDFCIIGDGERAVVSLVEGIRTGDMLNVPGLAYQTPSGEKRTHDPLYVEDLDSLPFPNRSLLDYGKYEKVGLITTRGCPYKCFYCKPMQDKLFGRKIRRRSPANVAQEIAQVTEQMGKRLIHFRDDTITIGGLDWFTEFNRLINTSIPGGISFQCNSRVDQVTDEKLKLMKEAGCNQIFFGVESGSQKVLDFYKKGTTPEQAVEAFRLCKKYKIQTVAAIMLGAPVENVEDVKLTYNLVKKIKPDNWIVYTTTPFPGNYLYEYAKENKLLRVSKSEEFDNAMNKRNGFMPIELKNLSSEDLKKYSNKIDRYMILYSALKWRTVVKVFQRPRSAYYKIANLFRMGRKKPPLKPGSCAFGTS
jgi:radical SAM superfamily enzyme YgiQ (UPF0313 family)